jgi:DNA-binding beta-propeller fold protein YncE
MPITRRRYLTFAALSIAAACGRKKGTGYPGYALIATSGETTMAVVDLLSFKLLSPIPLGAAPTAVIQGPGGKRSYILTPSSGSIHVLNPALEIVARRKLADQVSQVLLSADGATILAISAANHELILADAASLAVRRRYKLRAEPVSLDANSNGDIAIGLRGESGIDFFPRDSAHRQAAVDGEPGVVRFRADGKVLIVSKPAARSLSILNVPDLQLMADLPLAMQPDNLCFLPDGGQLFVTGEGVDAVAIVFPYRTLEVEQTILAGRSPGVMACCESPPYLFVASSNGSDLTILNVENRKVIGILEVGLQPRFIAITPDNQYALVLNVGSNDMAVIRITAIHPTWDGLRNGVALFTLLPVGSRPVHAAVIPRA